MPKHEFELITGEKLRHVKVFANDVTYRNYHFHGAFEFLLVLEGSGSINLAAESIPAVPGSLIVVNPNDAHELVSYGGPLRVLTVQISRYFCREYVPELGNIRFLQQNLTKAAMVNEWRQILFDAAALYLQAPPYFSYLFLAKVTTLFYSLLVHLPHEQLSNRNQAAIHKRMERMNRILDYVEEHYTEPIRLQDIATIEGVTTTYISHFFSEQMGVTLQEYLGNLRFERAAALLSTHTVSVSEAAYQSGFSAPKYFNAMMQKRMSGSFAGYCIRAASEHPTQENTHGPLEQYLSTELTLDAITKWKCQCIFQQ